MYFLYLLLINFNIFQVLNSQIKKLFFIIILIS